MKDLYVERYQWRSDEYKKLQTLKAGMTLARFEELLGSPDFVTRSESGNLREALFHGREYWAQAIYDEDETVLLYSITSCSSHFNPRFDTPAGKVKLNLARMAELGQPQLIHYLLATASGNMYTFDEYYFGNPGGYKTYFFGVSDGCRVLLSANSYRTTPTTGSKVIVPDTGPPLNYLNVNFPQGNSRISNLRETSVLNTYAETAPFVGFEEISDGFQIGANRILTRTVNR